jgi:hypothetical protein
VSMVDGWNECQVYSDRGTGDISIASGVIFPRLHARTSGDSTLWVAHGPSNFSSWSTWAGNKLRLAEGPLMVKMMIGR